MTLPSNDEAGSNRKKDLYAILEELYVEYNRREYVSPDPLEFLYHYDNLRDREVVGLIASSFAYGRVGSILASVRKILNLLGGSPADALASMDFQALAERMQGFRHRFAGDDETASFLYGIGGALRFHGSLERVFFEGLSANNNKEAVDILSAMDHFTSTILSYGKLGASHLLPCASKGSACKRLALYLRWMARCDDVDPGGWQVVQPCQLILPLDTHMFKIVTGLGFTKRKNADGRAAWEATEAFRRLCPNDPVRYDFALTRFGIRTGLSVDALLERLKNKSNNERIE